MQIVRGQDQEWQTKRQPQGSERRRYYMPGEVPLELIEVELDPETIEERHSHAEVREAILVLEGMVTVVEFTGADAKVVQHLATGDMVVFDRGVAHMLATSSSAARVLAAKFTGGRKSVWLFATDKHVGTTAEESGRDYRVHVELFRHFDTLHWQVAAFVSGVVVLILGAAATLLSAKDPLLGLGRDDAVAFTLLGAAVVCVMSGFTLHRIRLHRDGVVSRLANEDPKYFGWMATFQPRRATSSRSIGVLFFGVGYALLLFVLAYALRVLVPDGR